MTVTSIQQAQIDNRRRWVARLTLRGLTQREIAHHLYEQGISVNPNTGGPWTHVTIGNDLRALKKQWREQAAIATDERQARHLAELLEVRRAGWGKEELTVVLRALRQEAELLGLNAPEKQEISLSEPVILRVKGFDDV